MVTKRALVTGITGQDGSYLAELLIGKGYEVHGLVRRSSSFNTARLEHLYQDPHDEAPKLVLHYGDVMDAASIRRVLSDCNPDELYNLAAQSHVKVSFDQPVYSAEVGAIGALNVLEAVRDYDPTIRVYQASSSEMFGDSPPPQSETTPFRPRSPYACAKVFAYWQAVNYREAYGMHVSNGILFNHESPRRGETFVTRKITRAATRIREGLQDKLYLGNINARRDWGFAGDYVEAMWMMLQQEQAGDYVIATGQEHSVHDFVTDAFLAVGIDDPPVEIDPNYFRPTEVERLCGDASKAREVLGWEPKVSFQRLIRDMIGHDRTLAREERVLKAYRDSPQAEVAGCK